MSRARDLADLGGSADAGTVTGESLIINGDMAVAQRSTSANTSGSGQYLAADRFAWFQENTDQVIATVSQDTNAPDGFSNSHKIAISTAETTLDSDEIAGVYQPIEAQNLQHLKFGTSSAESLTLSFWVKSTETGTYAVLFYLPDGTARGITKNYTISTANTWEYKTITIDGDTSGTIDDNNDFGMGVYWVLSSGSGRGTVDGSSWRNYDANQFGYGHTADVLTDSSATWQITGVKLEVGSTATPFQHESYAENLQKCQRYYQQYLNPPLRGVCAGSSGAGRMGMQLPVIMRASPSLTITQTGSTSHFRVYDGATTVGYSSVDATFLKNSKIEVDFTVSSGLTLGRGLCLYTNDSYQSSFGLNAEL